ncbi:MAG TPA: response regulator, partial [Nitrospira sp.]|nr:response regulator [Nitrospira sp.]
TETSPAPDLVLLDISLPNLSGLEILRTIRSTPGWRQIPVVMLTANTLPESMTEANNLGATEYLRKPFSTERLLQIIESFLPLPQTTSPSPIDEQS